MPACDSQPSLRSVTARRPSQLGTKARAVGASMRGQPSMRGDTQEHLALALSSDGRYACFGSSAGLSVLECETWSTILHWGVGPLRAVGIHAPSSSGLDGAVVAYVGTGDEPALSPRHVHLSRAPSGEPLGQLFFLTTILALRLNARRLVVLLEKKVHVHAMAMAAARGGNAAAGGAREGAFAPLLTLDAQPNPRGILSLSPWHSLQPDNAACFLAMPAQPSTSLVAPHTAPSTSTFLFPPSQRAGSIVLVDLVRLQVASQIDAHEWPLAALALSPDGALVASASQKGTVIRIHSVASGAQLLSLRRGSLPHHIYSLAFAPSLAPQPAFLVAASGSGTLHLFALPRSNSGQGDGETHSGAATDSPGAEGAEGRGSMGDAQGLLASGRAPHLALREALAPLTPGSCAISPVARDLEPEASARARNTAPTAPSYRFRFRVAAATTRGEKKSFLVELAGATLKLTHDSRVDTSVPKV